MNDRAPALRRPVTGDPVIDESFRDLDDYMRGTLRWIEVPQFDAQYTEPFFVKLEQEPIGLVCVRVRPTAQLTAALVAGGVVPFEWDGVGARAKILKVDGLTVGTTYRFNLIAVN